MKIFFDFSTDIGPVSDITIRTALRKDKERILRLRDEMKNIILHLTSAHVQEESRRGCFNVGPCEASSSFRDVQELSTGLLRECTASRVQ